MLRLPFFPLDSALSYFSKIKANHLFIEDYMLHRKQLIYENKYFFLGVSQLVNIPD